MWIFQKLSRTSRTSCESLRSNRRLSWTLAVVSIPAASAFASAECAEWSAVTLTRGFSSWYKRESSTIVVDGYRNAAISRERLCTAEPEPCVDPHTRPASRGPASPSSDWESWWNWRGTATGSARARSTPILHGMEKDGLLRSRQDQIKSHFRRVYRATPPGKESPEGGEEDRAGTPGELLKES